MSDASPAERKQQLKQRFESEVGYWNDEFDEWLDMDLDSFEVFSAFAAHPWRSGSIPAKEKNLILVSLAAMPTHLNTRGTRFHIRNALDNGASAAELKEVLEIASIIGVHAMTEGLSHVVPEDNSDEDAMSTRKPTELKSDREREIREKFEAERGYWSSTWEMLLQVDPAFLEKYTELAAYPWNEGVLDPKMKEFIYIALDLSVTHLYTKGLDRHISQAQEFGATQEELVELVELVCVQGYDTMIESTPILAEEVRRYEAQNGDNT